MQDIEKVENNVNAKEIREKLLHELKLGPGEFATALGINYQRIYDLGSGRVKKFNPGLVNLICSKFPQVNPTFLYTGKGNVFLPEYNHNTALSIKDTSDLIDMSRKLIQLMEQLNQKDLHLREKEQKLVLREQEVDRRERELFQREIAMKETTKLNQSN